MSTTLQMNTFERSRFNVLMTQSYKKVFNMAYRLSGNRPDAEDLTQEAFYRAFRSFEDYEGDKPFENWIFRIATRLFLDLLRNRKRRVRAISYDAPLTRDASEEGLFFDVPDHGATPEDVLVGDMLSEDLQLAINSLNQDQQLLIKLADVEGMPYREIAQILGKPIGTIRSRLHRTHRLLRTRLAALEKGAALKQNRNRLKLRASTN